MTSPTDTQGLPARPLLDPRSIDSRALDAQRELLPYALAVFAVFLPAFVWAGTYARDAVWMSAIFLQFSVNWATFYAVINRVGGKARSPSADGFRPALHVGGGLLWALAVGEIALFASNAGPVRDILLSMDVAMAIACFFFTSACLRTLLIVGPAAALPPMAAFCIGHADRDAASVALGAMALALALCLVVNRILRRQFSLAAEREALIEDRAGALASAQQLAKSKAQILATLSHEIRNGLTGVTHVLGAAAGGGRTAPGREQLSAALGAANDLLDVLNATLDAETAGAGRLNVEAKPFDAARLARATALLARPKALSKGLELSVHIDDSLNAITGAAVGDSVRVRQILSNLVGNAVKYTTRGRVEVRVLRSAPDRVRFEVADTGPGLSPEELELAFEAFSRIERIGLGLPGAGLGLSLSRQLARIMGGDVFAESAVGVGSRFWFELPFDQNAAPMADPDEAEPAGFSSSATSSRNLRILIAEDDALNAAMLRAILEQLGHQVVHAHDGRRALELAEFCHFDVIMLDGRMPELSGSETASQIRSMPGATRDTPIVAVIGGDAEEAQACVLAGADEILRKPVTVAGVARALASAIGRGEMRSPSADAAVAERLVG